MIQHLPLVNACLNTLASILLVLGLFAIRAGKRERHETLMKSAFLVSALFLASYLTYHFTVKTVTKYTGDDRAAYFTLLISHTILAVVNLPMVLLTFRHALKKRWDKHKRLARWTFPIWLYVSVTGVAIYVWLYVV